MATPSPNDGNSVVTRAADVLPDEVRGNKTAMPSGAPGAAIDALDAVPFVFHAARRRRNAAQVLQADGDTLGAARELGVRLPSRPGADWARPAGLTLSWAIGEARRRE